MNYACDFSQSETEKYFEWMLIVIANSLWASTYTSRCNTFVEEVCNSRFLCTSTKSPFLGTGPKLTLLLHSDGVLNLISRAKKQIKSCSPGKRKRVVIYCKQFFFSACPLRSTRKLFSSKINACVRCAHVLHKKGRSFIRSFSRLRLVSAKMSLISCGLCRSYGKFESLLTRVLLFLV